ncbi:unnamed protein product [Bubo scandiacus]
MRLLILAVFALFYVAPREEGAGLLASKSLLNGCAVEDGTLQHLSYAAGSGVIEVSHVVLLQPLEAAYFNFTSAAITYLAQEGGQATGRWQILSSSSSPFLRCFLSAPGQGGILAQSEFDRRVPPHFLDRVVFGAMTPPSVGMLLL